MPVPYPEKVGRVFRKPRRSLPPQDLGVVYPRELPEGLLTWRRLRWTFGAAIGGARRPYVLDLGIDARAVDGALGLAHVMAPPLKAPEGSKEKAPGRVVERATEALRAMEGARPTVEALVVELKSLLRASRLDTDDAAAETERAERLISRLVDESCLKPYFGVPRERSCAVARALATGTADTWGRTVLHAQLRSLLVGSAVLSFDARGWPSLVAPPPDKSGASAGRWTWEIGGKP